MKLIISNSPSNISYPVSKSLQFLLIFNFLQHSKQEKDLTNVAIMGSKITWMLEKSKFYSMFSSFTIYYFMKFLIKSALNNLLLAQRANKLKMMLTASLNPPKSLRNSRIFYVVTTLTFLLLSSPSVIDILIGK